MNKTINILLISIFLIFISCNDNHQTTVSEPDRFELVPEPDKELREAQEQKDTLKDQKIIETVGCDEFSKEMKAFIELLKEDNYAIKESDDKSDLSFETYKDFSRVDREVSFSKDDYKTVFVKRKNKLKRRTDNWYPSFLVSEICLEDEQKASEKYQEISEIINHLDLRNDKNYDYILKNGNKLIYVSCGAKIFEEYAMSYKGKLKDIIKVNNGTVD